MAKKKINIHYIVNGNEKYAFEFEAYKPAFSKSVVIKMTPDERTLEEIGEGRFNKKAKIMYNMISIDLLAAAFANFNGTIVLGKDALIKNYKGFEKAVVTATSIELHYNEDPLDEEE